MDLDGCTLVIARLGRDIETRFGLSSEVMILFSPYGDLQRRSFNALTERARDELMAHQRDIFDTVRFVPEKDIVFIVSPDERATQKVREWNSSGAAALAIPIATVGKSEVEIRSEINREIALVLEERDLYSDRGPVTGHAFFGRNDLIRRISGAVRTGTSLGLFGLRRSGKTSVIREYDRRRRDADEIVVLSDLEAMDQLSDVPPDIGNDLNEALRHWRSRGGEAFIGNEQNQLVDSTSELSRRIKQVAKRNPDLRFLFAIDEIESLRPHVENDPQSVRALLGSLRTAAQAADNVSLLFTGVTTRFFTGAKLADEIDNPLFGFIDPVFLRPFEIDESTNLIKDLGRKMRMAWDDDAAEAVHHAAGGHPFLLRALAARVRSACLETKQDPLAELVVGVEAVEKARTPWTRESAALWEEIVGSLDIHHPIMASLLEADGVEIKQWLDAGLEADVEAQALVELGLFHENGGEYLPTDALIALQSLSSGPGLGADKVQARLDQENVIRNLIERGEGEQLEFKQTARWNPATQQADKKLEHEVVRAVSGFLNSDGGTLLIGVEDGGSIAGIDGDLKLSRGSVDRFQVWLQGALLGPTCGEDISAECLRVSFPNASGQAICRIDVNRSSSPVWIDGPEKGTFYVRSGNSTKRLVGEEQFRYVSEHW